MEAARDFIARLEATVERATPALRAISDARSGVRPAPGKWCPREVLGHLIDSATNNHQRFVRAAFSDDLVCPPYDQNAWVSVQRHAGAPWNELVTLWAAFNRHIARVMAALPAEARQRVRRRHNLHQIAWRTIPAGEPATLDDFMEDYVGHLRHHLAQILGPRWDGGAS